MGERATMDGREYVLPDDAVIITHTDIQGRITYANAEFLHSSGLGAEECIGQPHNITRHPDMPAQVFADMWSTIRAGRPWCGLIKNRRRDGSHVWLRANVSPITQGRTVVGYVSVRFKPRPEEIGAADALYRAMRGGGARHLRLQEGRLVDASLAGRLRGLVRPTLWKGTYVCVGALAALFATIGALVLASDAVRDATLRSELLAASLLGVFGAVSNIIYVQWRVVRGLERITADGRQFLAGDLKTRFDVSADPLVSELGLLLTQISAKLHGIVRDTQVATAAMTGSVAGIRSANAALAERAQTAAANLEETAATIEQITATVNTNMQGAQQAAGLAQRAAEITAHGGEVVGDVVRTMASIAAASRRISEIVGMIDGIAFQTNLLALNAAVEAARAGEQGRGFAVVAQEVRSLAQRAAGAAREVREVIAESGRTVEHGTELATRAGATMDEVVAAVGKVATIIGEIGEASREQSVGVEQMGESVMQIDQITQQNASMAQDITASARTVEEQAATVLRGISSFGLSTPAVAGGAAGIAGAVSAPPVEPGHARGGGDADATGPGTAVAGARHAA
ncbi:MAG: methyl-accepting chemotaxis protein [Steroidobacteraceae bacterium]